MTTYDLTKGYLVSVGIGRHVYKEYKLIINGVGYKSEMEACRKLGVNFVTYRHRKYRGLTVE